MHGECKTPGGKLIAVDLDIKNEAIHNVRISGDFFVHPESEARNVLHRLSTVITEQTEQLPVQQWNAKLNAALPWDVELLGTSTQALAVALCRALGQPAELEPLLGSEHQPLNDEELAFKLGNWSKVAWHLLPEVALSPAMNVALDEVLCQQVAQGKRPATLRFWRWSEQAVILGRCQSVLNEVDVASAAALSVRIVRRMTGGGAMFLQPHGAITYSLYLPEEMLKGIPLRQSYQVCESWVIDGFAATRGGCLPCPA